MDMKRRRCRKPRFRLLLTAVALLLLGAQVRPQDPVAQGPPQADAALKRAALAGHWTLYAYEEGTPPPPPPPFASQRPAQDQIPPLESVPRVNFRVEEGKIFGSAVFPEGILLTEENRDVTGRESVPLEELEFDGQVLKFAATVGGRRLEAELEAKGSRFFGKWKIPAEDTGGDLYLVRRR